jgi:hypothetical protein
MSVTVQEESGNLNVMRISGLLKKSEYDAVQAAAAQRWRNIDSVKLLIIVDDFKGWERNDEWGDLSFYIEHREKIKKIAIVGDLKHEMDMMMFAGAGFRPAPVKYFPSEQIGQARQWLVESAR